MLIRPFLRTILQVLSEPIYLFSPYGFHAQSNKFPETFSIEMRTENDRLKWPLSEGNLDVLCYFNRFILGLRENKLKNLSEHENLKICM